MTQSASHKKNNNIQLIQMMSETENLLLLLPQSCVISKKNIVNLDIPFYGKAPIQRKHVLFKTNMIF